MRNFLGLMVSILISVFAVSCDGQVRELDMTTKGIVKARVVIVENSSFSRYNASKIFFKTFTEFLKSFEPVSFKRAVYVS